MKDRLKAAKIWFLWRMLRISWIEKKSNEEVLREAGVQRTLMKTIRQRQLAFLGHIMRRHGLENLEVTGRIEGKRVFKTMPSHDVTQESKLPLTNCFH